MNWLIHLRVIMYILVSAIYFMGISGDDFLLKGLVLIIAILFMINHFYMFFYPKGGFKVTTVILDGLLCFSYAFMFPSSTLYIILVGVTATTLFIGVSDRTVHVKFCIGCVFLWVMAMYLAFIQGVIIPYGENLMNAAFVVFSIFVGDLIRRLSEVNAVMNEQYEQLNDAHEELAVTYEQLQQYSREVEDLTVIRERNRIAREIHDTVGHKMTALLVQLQLARELHPIDVKKSASAMKVCEDLARSALEEVRFSVRTLHNDDEKSSLISTIRNMLAEFNKMTGLQTSFTLQGNPAVILTSIQLTIIRAIQEMLTNAKRHGRATKCRVRLICLPEKITLQMSDNGVGTSQIVPGFGLTNMRERMIDLGGSVLYESETGKGFSVLIEIPLTEKKWDFGG